MASTASCFATTMPSASLIRPAWRSLLRAPAFTITAVTTLVLGLSAVTAIFALVNGVLLRPLPYEHPDRLVGAWHDLEGISLAKANQTSATYFTYARFARSIDGIGIYQESAVNVSDPAAGSEPQRISTAFVSASMIPVLGVAPLTGRNFSEVEDLPNGPEVVIIAERLWRSRFDADRDVLGRTLEVNGRSREIIGVMPDRFRFPTAETQLWLPLQRDPNAAYAGGFSYNAIARLRPGVTVAEAERDFAGVLPRVVEISPNLAPGVSTQMLLDQAKPTPVLIPYKEDLTGGIARTLWIVAAAAGLVLLVACANVTNLILVRADARQRELAVREALGAGRARVLAYFLAESAVLTAAAAVVAVGITVVALRALVNAGPEQIPRLADVRVDLATIGFAIAIAAAVALVCSIIPAMRLGRVQLSNALREGGRGGTSGRVQRRVRSALVATQIAFALVALAGSGLLLRTFQRLNAIRPGFAPENVATFWMSLPGARYPSDTAVVQFYSRLLDRAGAIPGIEAVGISSRLPLLPFGMNQNPFYPEGDATWTDRIPPLQIFATTDSGYFRAMGIPRLAGRTFHGLEAQRPDEAIISQATAIQFWRDSTGERTLGKRFQVLPGGPYYTVVGVVGTVRDTSLAAAPTMAVYFPQTPSISEFDGQTRNTMALVVRTAGDPLAVSGAVRAIVRELDPTLPLFQVRPMENVFRSSMAQLSFTIVVLGAAAVVTLLLGAIGLYGVMAYVVALRSRELGLRIALGATPRGVIAMLTRQGVLLTAAGVAGGLVLFALVARFLRTLLYGVATSDPPTLAAASLLLVSVAVLATWIPARRTSRLDPADVLRAE